jgi:hypothetical protein
MSDEPLPMPTVPPLRFGLRAMLVSTAIAALFAAVAAPLSWGASATAQRYLAIAWCTALASVFGMFVYTFLRSRRLPRKGGRLRFYGAMPWQRRWSPQSPPGLYWATFSAWPGLTYYWFDKVAYRANSDYPSMGGTIYVGVFVGVLLSKLFRPLIPWPVALMDEGIVEYGKLLRWERFSRAERLADRPAIIKLHRIHYDFLGQDDLCIQLKPEVESAVLAFLSEKIAASRGGAK